MENKFNDKNMIKDIFFNIIKAIILILYFFALNISYKYIKNIEIYDYIKIFSIIFLGLGIINLEKAYKKESGKSALFSIELFIISAHSVSVEYVINKFGFDIQIYLLASSYIFAIYYVLKSIIIYTKARMKYLKSFSDVPEIVKQEKPKIKEAKKKEEKNQQEKNTQEEKQEIENLQTDEQNEKTKETKEKQNIKEEKDKAETNKKQKNKDKREKAKTKENKIDTNKKQEANEKNAEKNTEKITTEKPTTKAKTVKAKTTENKTNKTKTAKSKTAKAKTAENETAKTKTSKTETANAKNN